MHSFDMPSTTSKNNAPQFLSHFIMFCRMLKQEGLKVSIRQEIDSLRCLEHIDIFDSRDFYYSLRTNLVSRTEDIPAFNKIFSQHWRLRAEKGVQEVTLDRTLPSQTLSDDTSSGPNGNALPNISNVYYPQGEEDIGEKRETMRASTYSPAEGLEKKDFGSLNYDDLEEIQKTIRRIAWKLRLSETRRKEAALWKRFFDLRRTIRKNILLGGGLITIAWRRSRIAKTRIIVLCDVSGSMQRYSRFLLQFLYSSQHSFRELESFVFSTRLTRISAILRKEGYERALNKISQAVHDCWGGTRIGECFSAFNQHYAPSLLCRRAVVIIISDGWDRGDEHRLREAMKQLRRKAYHIIWLNPLLGSPQYQPTCKGMQTALPYLDQFLPLHNLESLIKLEHVLSCIA